MQVQAELEALRDPDVATLLQNHRIPLWNIYRSYCPDAGVFGQKKDLTFDGTLALASDFDLMPKVCGSRMKLLRLFTLCIVRAQPDRKRNATLAQDDGPGLAFEGFLDCLVRMAARCFRKPHGGEDDLSPVVHLETLLDLMGASPGPGKLSSRNPTKKPADFMLDVQRVRERVKQTKSKSPRFK